VTDVNDELGDLRTKGLAGIAAATTSMSCAH